MLKNIYTIGSNRVRGFTLVELLVSVFIFSVIMVLVGSLFVYSLDLQRRAFNLQQTEENATFLIETMLKEFRVSDVTFPLVASDCPAIPSQKIAIIHPDLGPITYELIGTNVERNGVALNSNTIEFTKLGFCVSGAVVDGKQTRITMIASIRSSKTSQQSLIDIQTSISPRKLND